jgi:formylglycine-generating enzyme required for sulfatase activity
MWHQVMGTNRSRIQVIRAEREQLSGDNEIDRAPRGLTRDKQRPVERVRWYEAVTFCAKLAECTGNHSSLPSEAQWVPGQRSLNAPGKGP